MKRVKREIIETITGSAGAVRDRDAAALLASKSREDLLQIAEELEDFRKKSSNLYHRVRACLFIHSIYRYHLIDRPDVLKPGIIPYAGIRAALNREFDTAILRYRAALAVQGANEALLSALAQAYYDLAFKYLLDQVRSSVRTSRGNEWMFAAEAARRYPLRACPAYLEPDPATGLYPVGMDASPVRADPCHSGWSDIFFLGMDYPEGARVVNMSVDLCVRGGRGEHRMRWSPSARSWRRSRDQRSWSCAGSSSGPVPPCECYCRFIPEPVVRLVSLDLACTKDVATVSELFNFGNDHLGLLKAGVIASGAVPPGSEHAGVPLGAILEKLLGRKGGFELATLVRDIPKGSRLAVSTTLLAVIITRLMRFTNQIKRQTGGLDAETRRCVAARAILGEWLGGSGGGWQDSGGIWPGIKVITGVAAARGDPEYGVSRGRLLPRHRVLSRARLAPGLEGKLAGSLVMVHGGLSQNVGPILEMVTTRYLLRSAAEWEARQEGIRLFEKIVPALVAGNMKKLGDLVTRDWEAVTKVIIPWTSNAYTEDLIAAVKADLKADYYGFLMLGGASGGGMAFLVNPRRRERFMVSVLRIMKRLKDRYERALPFAMDPVVYDWKLNHDGIMAELMTGARALMPAGYYAGLVPVGEAERRVIDRSGVMTGAREEKQEAGTGKWKAAQDRESARIRKMHGFDAVAHEANRKMLKAGKIGAGQNRLPAKTVITDVEPGDLELVSNDLSDSRVARHRAAGKELLASGAAAVVTFAGGLGSRWADGASIVKPINPFVWMNGRHRSFVELHMAKSQDFAVRYGQRIQHVFTTSYLTHDPLARELSESRNFGYGGRVYLSPGRSISQRVYPMARDLKFIWEETLQQKLDPQAQKVQDDLRRALIAWARDHGEGGDYGENTALQRFNPPGHFYEIPNMIRNGTLGHMLRDNRGLKHLLAHNADTTGVFLSPIMLGMHDASGKMANFEVTPRRYEDKGGGLARVNGRPRIVEAPALPREEDEFKLTYYNTLTSWISIDGFLSLLGLGRKDVLAALEKPAARARIDAALHKLEARVPTYVTIREVKMLWGAGQEDVFPVAQFEKLWGDITWLPDADCGFFAVERRRGQQLKDPAQLDRFVLDGSRDYVASKCVFTRK